MKKEVKKCLFRVIRRDVLNYGDGRVEQKETYLGETWATTPAKAISNIKFREGIREEDLECSWGCGGYRTTNFSAIRVR